LSFAGTGDSEATCCLNYLDRLSIALAKEGLQMTYLHWPWNRELPTELITRADGFILLEGSVPARVSRQIAAKPTISLFCPAAGPGDQILTGYYQVGQLAASHLLRLNIRHMVLLHPSHQPGFIIEEGEGFKLFCMKEGNIVFEELTTQTQNSSSAGKEKPLKQQVQELMDRVLQVNDGPLGIFAPSCHVTALAYRTLYQRGIMPGKDIHFVCSSHHTSLLCGLYPKPAVIDIGLTEMAENAARLLLLRIKNPNVNQTFQVSVIPRLLDCE
jgi:DNA-binding LacI/PurR family transcriptional regulator